MNKMNVFNNFDSEGDISKEHLENNNGGASKYVKHDNTLSNIKIGALKVAEYTLDWFADLLHYGRIIDFWSINRGILNGLSNFVVRILTKDEDM